MWWWLMWSRKKQPEEPDHYYECRLLPAQRDALLKFLEGDKLEVVKLQEIIVRVKAAKRYDLPPVEVDWQSAEREAAKRGESLVEWLEDAPWELER
jgi:hypothetical protein